MRAHEWIDRRSLALHEAVAAKLEAQPQLIEVARANLRRWLSTNPAAALREWWQLLETTPLQDVLVLLRSSGDEAVRLRQSSPFAGLLSPAERQSILNDYESRRAWMAQWNAARTALSAQRATELRALSNERALAAADALLSFGPLAVLPEDRRTSSGLVRQQELLHRQVAP